MTLHICTVCLEEPCPPGQTRCPDCQFGWAAAHGHPTPADAPDKPPQHPTWG